MTLTLNRPDVFNSFNQEMGRAFQSALDDAASNDLVRCVVITGNGRAFCAGQDLKEVTSEASPGFKVIVEETYNRSIRRICDMEKPVVAAVNGVAAGAGANIALACDFVVAKSSVKFIQAFEECSFEFLPFQVGLVQCVHNIFFNLFSPFRDLSNPGQTFLFHEKITAEKKFQFRSYLDALRVQLSKFHSLKLLRKGN